jgi:hypothetical protein
MDSQTNRLKALTRGRSGPAAAMDCPRAVCWHIEFYDHKLDKKQQPKNDDAWGMRRGQESRFWLKIHAPAPAALSAADRSAQRSALSWERAQTGRKQGRGAQHTMRANKIEDQHTVKCAHSQPDLPRVRAGVARRRPRGCGLWPHGIRRGALGVSRQHVLRSEQLCTVRAL